MKTLLSEKGIKISEIEMVTLLESAVKNMNYSSLTSFVEEIKEVKNGDE